MDRISDDCPMENREGGFPEDRALLRHLARQTVRRGEVRLRLDRRGLRRLERALEEARRLRHMEGVEDEALTRLDAQGGLILACARRAGAEGGARLTAWRSGPRLLAALEALCGDGESAVDGDRLTAAIEALDSAQPLTQAELWAVPAALRIALTHAFLRVAEDIVSRARRCARAARWARRPSGRTDCGDPAFVECALRIAGEEGLPEARLRLDEALARRGLTPEAVIARAQAARAGELLRLENLQASRRALDALNWRDCFERLSRVERELQGDPAGIYPRMDDASRDAVREQVALLARRLRVPEAAVARSAVDAARTGEGVRRGVCGWLYEDEGREALLRRMGEGDARARRLIPDPTGRRTSAALAALAALLTLALAACAGTPWLALLCLPLGWTSASALAGRFFPLLFRPNRLLKLELESVPGDCRTLVVLPALLSSAERAGAVCGQLEALGCLERDENISYLILGDLPDAEARELPGDGDILARARERIAAMNARAGREKYALLCRARTRLEPDGVWMGRDRKRGALEDLNRLLLGREDAEASFAAEGAACERLRDAGIAYVITLDADTRMLPGDARKLIGAMAHPLNRRYAVLQPRMETPPSARLGGFARLFAGAGGLNAYPVSVSNLWQDMTGRGIYAGKGIYDVAAFQGRLEGALPEGRVLSHDLIEGALAGAGFLGDVALYDGYPGTYRAFAARQHRWIRGDWQLLPMLTSGQSLPGGPRLGPADRFRMLDNLIRSLRAPALLALLLAGVWTGRDGALVAALAVNYLEALLSPLRGDPLRWRRATAELAALPATAWSALDAIGRTLWRLGISGRRLMDWVTAADAEARSGSAQAPRVPGRAAALLLTPGLLIPGWREVTLALAALFLVGPAWIGDMERDHGAARESLSEGERAAFLRLARATWRFFSENVPPAAALPPDNVQLDPPVGAARRTSPTNIGLYLLGCLSAERLGFIGMPELRERLSATLDRLEAMEKWQGCFYNWYDIDTLAPLGPRYVSSVDCGNLAAALLLCAGAAEAGEDLARRMRALAEDMALDALYDRKRELFHIGIDVGSGRLSEGRYDLLASESRILSYAAMMLGRVPARHWQRLGRPCAAVAGGVAPLSWSGTMFEYLMPELFLAAPPNSMLGEGVRAAVGAQREQGRRRGRPWGVSESGYCALDGEMNYQYRAFGLRALALDGEAEENVVAPYASMLAAAVAPGAAAENLARMEEMGWLGDWGLYEAADYLRLDGEGRPALVRSHMAHHQGMILCALCNALIGDSLREEFMGLPEARALSLLVEELPGDAAGPRRRASRPRSGGGPAQLRLSRAARRDALAPETHLLFGGGATALYTSDGAIHYRRGDVCATRFSGALQGRIDRARVHLTDLDGGGSVALGDWEAETRFEAGSARSYTRLNRLEAALTTCLSPEDGTLLRIAEVRNGGDVPVCCAVSDVVPVALAREGDWRAHAAFQDLFAEGAPADGDALVFRRRPGSRGPEGMLLIHLAAGPGTVTRATDWDLLAGRASEVAASSLAEPLPGVTATLNPVSALRTELRLAPGASARVCFALSLLEGEAAVRPWLDRWRRPGQTERAEALADARVRALLGYVGLEGGEYQALQRLAALLADGALAAQARESRRGEPGAGREALWPLGISGDRPLLLMRVTDAGHGERVRALIRAHAFYRAAGIEVDLALLDEGEAGYARPLRDMLEGLISTCHLNRLRGVPGGVWVLEGSRLDGEARRALERNASAAFDSNRDFYVQVRALLAALAGPVRAPLRPMDLGASVLKPQARVADNGFGGFLPEGGYAVDVLPDRLPPAPWCDILANEAGGLLLSERGGGFLWAGNSREGRLTPYGNDPMREGWGLSLLLADGERGEALRLLPGERPQIAWRVTFNEREIRYAFDNRRASGTVRFSMSPDRPEATVEIELENKALRAERLRLFGFVDWLMGADRSDAARLSCWQEGGACLATGAMPGTGYFAAASALAQPGPGRCAFLGRGDALSPRGLEPPFEGEGWSLWLPLRLRRGEAARVRLALGWAEDVGAARARVRALTAQPPERPGPPSPRLSVETPDAALNRLVNDFLRHQVRASRFLGRVGPCQPGGAWGFRDQLQDALALLHDEPRRVREHLLRCAARQFEAGDALHWWHEPCRGVRTRISDDVLFLPWTAAAYVSYTGDAAVLDERIPYLKNAEIPEGGEDLYAPMEPSEVAESLHGHCMRAFRRAARLGRHGLALMGAGDWNDGMNRVGAAGQGESVWLTEFLIACADRYREVAPNEADRDWLKELANGLRRNVEASGWDGEWYLRGYFDDGSPLGGAGCTECRIDAISQAWAVLAGLDCDRCRVAVDAAWRMLADEDAGVIRLLTPPFEGKGPDPGYIRGYPPGIRENGGQYTHGALWLLLALIELDDGARAHRALQMLLPYNHANASEKALTYRAEPYVMAADVYDHPAFRGRAGWTWYTGSAGWMFSCVLALLGYERRGDLVRLNALLGDWPSAAVTVPFGASRYHLICDKKAVRVTLDGEEVGEDYVRLADDGRNHEARFPARRAREDL